MVRRWITSEAIIVHRRDLVATLPPNGAADRHPFTSSLLEGPRALKRHELADLAVTAGAPRALAQRDAGTVANYVREAFRRGDLVAFRRTGQRPHAPGTINITGSFSDYPDARSAEAHENGWDAETRYELVWYARWRIRRASRQTLVTMQVTARRLSLQTTYHGGATRSSPHSRHGTLGSHEDLHKRVARAWWTTENMQAIAVRERIALDLVLPEGMSKAAVEARCQRQLDAVKHFMTDLHQHHQRTTLDGSGASPPTFAGLRR